MDIDSYITSKRPQKAKPLRVTLKPGSAVFGRSADELIKEIEENKYALEEFVTRVKISTESCPPNSR